MQRLGLDTTGGHAVTATLPPDVWVPVPIRWRHILPGDVFVDRDGALWHVNETRTPIAGLWIKAAKGVDTVQAAVDFDDVIHVLIPVPERDAVELTRDTLGARLIGRRTASAPREE